jgi:hypothetical protein
VNKYVNNHYPTPEVTNKELFREGDYYIAENNGNVLGIRRNSIIIHECPRPPSNHLKDHPGVAYKLTLTMPQGFPGTCYWCHQNPPEGLLAVYMLHNFDHFANDSHGRIFPPWNLRKVNNPSS